MNKTELLSNSVSSTIIWEESLGEAVANLNEIS